VAPRRSSRWPAVAGALALLAVGGVWLARKSPTLDQPNQQPSPPPVAKSEPIQPKATAPATPAAPVAPNQEVEPPPERRHATTAAGAPHVEVLSPEAARELAEAETALEAGRNADAVRLAQHSLYAQKSSRAYATIARARCATGDLGNARAALSQVAPRDRVTVMRACNKLGVDLH